MKTKGLKIVDKKHKLAQRLLEIANYIYNNKSQNTSIYYFPYKIETSQCIGNWDQFDHFKYITVPRKFYMTMDEYWKKEARRKHYKNKIKFYETKKF